jgi:hypothetical protein
LSRRIGGRAGLEARGNNTVLIKDIIAIKRGELIKGFTVEPFNFRITPSGPPPTARSAASLGHEKFRPRIATMNIEGWSYPDPTFTQAECPEIRTLFYPASGIPSSLKPRLAESINRKDLRRFVNKDLWWGWVDSEVIVFRPAAPIGVHLGEFIIGWVGKRSSLVNNLYTKVLLIDGRIGYIIFETEDRENSRAELI